MVRICLVILFGVSTLLLQAQSPGIDNVRVNLSESGDTLIVQYDLFGNSNATNVMLDVRLSDQTKVVSSSVFGDIGSNVTPGKNKIVYWDMQADNVMLNGQNISVKILADVFVELPVVEKKERWIPWFYIASGAAVTTGLVSQLIINDKYDKYLNTRETPDAEALNTSIRNWEMTRNISFGAAGALGAVGVYVHVLHRKKKNDVALGYIPRPNGAEFGLTFNF